MLLDGAPFYSCHTLATEAVGKKILTIEGVGDEKNLHPLQRVGYTLMAADCGFCTAGWVVTAKGLLDKNLNPSEDQVKAALAGHICRCAAYPNIIRAVMDSAAVLRGSQDRSRSPKQIRSIRIKMPMVRDYSTSGGHLPGTKSSKGASKTVTKKWQGYPPENLKVVGQAAAALPEVAIPRFTGKAHVRQPRVVPRSAVREVSHVARTRARASRTSMRPQRKKCRACDTSLPTRMRRNCSPTRQGKSFAGTAAPGTESSRRSGSHSCCGDRRPRRGCRRRNQGHYKILPFASC